MRTVRRGLGVAAVAAMSVVSACAGGSDAAVDTLPDPPVDAAADVEGDVDGEGDAAPSLPTNAGPEEISGTSEPDDGELVDDGVSDGVAEGGSEDVADDAKVVVTRSAAAGEVGVLPEGVGSVTARVTSVDGDLCEVCLWLADDDVSRRRGLMGVTDLGDAVGMAFVWERPRTGNFFMFQTPTPLSIAWFDGTGAHVGEADMEPCLVDDSATCERYTADSPYVVAVEMFGGQLDAVGIGPGASIELLDLPCM